MNLYYTNNVIGEQFFQMLKKFGLAVPQYNVLRILREESPDAVSIGFIKERMLERNPDVSRIVDRLYKKELVERKENESDRRQKDVLITKKGSDLLGKMVGCEEQEDANLSKLSKKKVKLLNELLDKIR